MISETELKGCFKTAYGFYLFTAGQRIDPSSESQFVWRVTSRDGDDTVSTMAYTNWHPNEPNYMNGKESCMHLWSALSYKWNDIYCHDAFCSVCEWSQIWCKFWTFKKSFRGPKRGSNINIPI